MTHSPDRKIIIAQPINSQIAGYVIDRITEINDYDYEMELAYEKMKDDYEPEPIEIYINSGGGSAPDGFAIIGAMEMSDTPIITHGLGIVASMALAIFLAGDVRVSSRHTRFMYHEVLYNAEGSLTEHAEIFLEISQIRDMYDQMFSSAEIFTKEEMANICRQKLNYFFSVYEAKKRGLVHEITEKKQRIKLPEKVEEVPTEKALEEN
ncbi:ATP-dependent Clp protease proteolytic subunit [Halobacillus rhizosphaerae]|uniref:ATP-dependent Clp protease proteolytic subunit n=1 Tax=Halobacillus rhizosphaerae TaxID=3064889 RepID=UPI00398AD549